MIVFYSTEINDLDGVLKDEEFHHCTHVLRKKVNDEINVTDGEGHLFKSKVVQINRSNLEFKILESKLEEKSPIVNCIAISPTKSNDRNEWFLEKAIEIGIHEIAFVNFERTEKQHINQQRLNKIALSAMKQSLQYYLPKLNFYKSSLELINKFNGFEQKLIANCTIFAESTLASQFEKSNSSIIVIGPEGDFTETEIQVFEKNNYKSISLGKTRLRTETAGIVAANILNFI